MVGGAKQSLVQAHRGAGFPLGTLRPGVLMKHLELRRALIRTCLEMNAVGINQGRAGNASSRIPGGLLITPTGIAYEQLRPSDMVQMTTDGSVEDGQRRPSSEWRFHLDILNARPDVGAIVHTHAPFCTALACLARGIPSFHYMIAVAGGDSIRCAPYATFGTQELSDHVLQALADRRACLLANHGMIAVGVALKQAFDLAVEIEALAGQYWRALQVGEPRLLSSEEMQTVLYKFESYGQQGE